MLVRLLQLLNALCPIEVTLSGIVMLFRLRQKANVAGSIEVTPSGMLNAGQTGAIVLNARFPIEVTLSGMVTLARDWSRPRECFTPNRSSRCLGIDYAGQGCEQLPNAESPIEVTGQTIVGAGNV